MKLSRPRTENRQLRLEWLESRLAMAGNVLLVSNPGGFAGLANTQDTALVQFLTSNGFTIDADSGVYQTSPPSAAALADVDVIIVSRATLSGEYANGMEPSQWNGLNVPMLVMNPLLAGTDRWGFVNTTQRVLDSPLTSTVNAFPDPNHPLVQGQTLNFYNAGKTVSYNTSLVTPANAKLVATFTAAAGQGAAIIDVPAGTTMLGGKGVTGERRILFAADDYPQLSGGQFSLAPGGAQALLRALNVLTGDFIVAQAEEATVVGAAVVASGSPNSHPGAYGAGYVDFVNASNDSIEWTISTGSSGHFDLRFRYALGATGERPLRLTVNGNVVDPAFKFASTGAWENWAEVSLSLPLTAGTNTIKLTATGASGPNFDQLLVAKSAIPNAPTGLSISGVSANRAVLSWVDGSTNETEFAVERRLASGGPFVEIGVAPANATSFVDETPAQGTSYAYRVRARNLSGASDYANEVQITTLLAGDNTPQVTSVTPAPGALGVFRDASIVATVSVPNGGINAATVSSQTVRLYPSGHPESPVEIVVNTSGGGDVIVVRPVTPLQPNVNYTFEVTSDLQDFVGNGFAPYRSTFLTGEQTSATDSSIYFEHVQLTNVPSTQYTCLTMGPDGKLYASTVIGNIVRWAILPDGTLGPQEVIGSLRTASGGNRLLIGIEFDPAATADNLILWATHSTFGFSNVADFGGRLTRLSGPNLETVQDAVINLPRSVRDHVTNQVKFGPDGALYFLQGSNSAMGAADNAWSNRPERLLTAAVLRFDPALWNATQGPVDVHTEDADPYDPFAPGAPLTIYATGLRNAYDLVWHSNGSLYVPTNGSAAGGNVPGVNNIPGQGLLPRMDEEANGPYVGPNVPALNNVGTQRDYLFRIEEGGYYGHPNITRNEYVLNGGNPTAGVDPGEVAQYPVGTLPDRNYRGFAFDFGFNRSPNGVIEYKHTGFGGKLAGKLLVAQFSSGDDIIVLQTDANGNIIGSNNSIASFDGFNDPLDLVENPLTGDLYVAEYSQATGQGSIRLLRPREPQLALKDSVLYYNDVPGSGPSASQTVEITNNGTSPLVIAAGGLSLAGPGAASFVANNARVALRGDFDESGTANAADLARWKAGYGTSYDGDDFLTWQLQLGGTLPVNSGSISQQYVIPPGAVLRIDVAFNPSATGLSVAQLLIQSNDTAQSLLTVSLRGLGHSQFQGGGEPPLASILALYQIPINVGFAGLTTPYSTALLGDEVLAPRLEKAGPGDIVIEPLATFGPASTPDYRIGWYEPGGSVALHQLAEMESLNPVAGGDGQSVNPIVASGSLVFDPGANPFGLYGVFPDFDDRHVYSEDALNTFDLGRRKFRYWPLKDSTGQVVPNAFVVGIEEATNNDLNDVVFIIRNVRPAPALAAALLEDPAAVEQRVEPAAISAPSVVSLTPHVSTPTQSSTAAPTNAASLASWSTLVGLSYPQLKPWNAPAAVDLAFDEAMFDEAKVFHGRPTSHHRDLSSWESRGRLFREEATNLSEKVGESSSSHERLMNFKQHQQLGASLYDDVDEVFAF